MSYRKRDIINQAHAEIGLGSYAFDAQPEELQDALMRLNALMAEWSSEGAGTGWPSVNMPLADDLDSDSNLPIDAVKGVICALAVDLAPSFGKTPMPTTVLSATRGKRLMVRKNTEVPQMAMLATAIPLGAGWKEIGIINLPASDSDIEEGEI